MMVDVSAWVEGLLCSLGFHIWGSTYYKSGDDKADRWQNCQSFYCHAKRVRPMRMDD